MEEIRLNKFLSESGICSRREADRLIEEGKVLVNGKKAAVGMKILGTEEIICNGTDVGKKGKDRPVLLAVNKPGRKISWSFWTIRSAFIPSAVWIRIPQAWS